MRFVALKSSAGETVSTVIKDDCVLVSANASASLLLTTDPQLSYSGDGSGGFPAGESAVPTFIFGSPASGTISRELDFQFLPGEKLFMAPSNPSTVCELFFDFPATA